MKWYCIKKYRPQTAVDLLIRAYSNIDNYERYFIASTEFYQEIDKLTSWYMANGAEHDIDFKKYTVTHFAIIDPIEVEE